MHLVHLSRVQYGLLSLVRISRNLCSPDLYSDRRTVMKVTHFAVKFKSYTHETLSKHAVAADLFWRVERSTMRTHTSETKRIVCCAKVVITLHLLNRPTDTQSHHSRQSQTTRLMFSSHFDAVLRSLSFNYCLFAYTSSGRLGRLDLN